MLGVRRSIVTLVMVTFEQRNLFQHHKGTLKILDRKTLETLSCECYSAGRGTSRLKDGLAPSTPAPLSTINS
jgi:hypothetical protein